VPQDVKTSQEHAERDSTMSKILACKTVLHLEKTNRMVSGVPPFSLRGCADDVLFTQEREIQMLENEAFARDASDPAQKIVELESCVLKLEDRLRKETRQVEQRDRDVLDVIQNHARWNSTYFHSVDVHNICQRRPPPPITVWGVMFAFRGEKLRDDAMKKVFQNVCTGDMPYPSVTYPSHVPNPNVKYCVANLFQKRLSNTLAELVEQYNKEVGEDWAIELDKVTGFPPIFGKVQFPHNPIFFKWDQDFKALPKGYRTWVNNVAP
jgi:hypothetical protein